MHANLNMHIMHANIQYTKTRTAPCKGGIVFRGLEFSLSVWNILIYMKMSIIKASYC